MAGKPDLPYWVVEALKANGGAATIAQVARFIWESYGTELKRSGDLFYTWQYDMRWAADVLRRERVMLAAHESQRGVWVLSGSRRTGQRGPAGRTSNKQVKR